MKRIRNILAKYSFTKDATGISYPRKFTNLADARSIGILYLLNDVSDYDIVETFVTRLQKDHKEVKAIGYVKNKELISRFLPKLSYDFFSRKDITWYYKPVHSKVKDFIDKEFDILIDLNLTDFFASKYISGLSKARCRVGMFAEDNQKYYDLMVDAKPGTTMEEYLEQICHYLTIIKDNETRV